MFTDWEFGQYCIFGAIVVVSTCAILWLDGFLQVPRPKAKWYGNMIYEVRAVSPDEWRVEAIDYDGDGQVFVAIFTGPGSMERAEEYAAWKSAARKPAVRV